MKSAHMLVWALGAAIALALTPSSWSQEPAKHRPGRTRTPRGLTTQPQKRYEQALEELQKALHDELNLTDEQKERIDQVIKEHAEHRTKILQERRALYQSEAVRELRQEMVEAHRAGDREKMQELRDKMQDLLQKPSLTAPQHEFLNKIKELLTDEQKQKFGQIERRFLAATRMYSPMDVLRHPRMLRRLLEKVELDQQKRTEIEALFARHDEELKTLGPRDRTARLEKAEELHSAVMNLLSDEEKQELKKRVAEMQRPTWRGGPDRPKPKTAKPSEEHQAE